MQTFITDCVSAKTRNAPNFNASFMRGVNLVLAQNQLSKAFYLFHYILSLVLLKNFSATSSIILEISVRTTNFLVIWICHSRGFALYLDRS